MQRSVDFLIVGAGFAGASTAFHLSQASRSSILIVEKEKIPGYHASGRNASLVLQSTADPEIRRMTALSRRAYAGQGSTFGFRVCGSLLLGARDTLERVRQPDLVPSEYWPGSRVLERVPLLEGHRFDSALWTPGDGVMDISRLLDFYLRGARSRGVEVALDCRLTAISGRGPFRVQTSQGELEAGVVVNAAGAWVREVAAALPATSLPMTPLKRHLFVLGVEGVDPDWPFVWNLAEQFYFRPESGGLLFSICDESTSSSLEPTVSPGISESLAALVERLLPALGEARHRKVWSCFRTRNRRDRFVIGWDPAVEGFFWVAGLGGHGMGASWEVGRLAAERLLDPERRQSRPFAPADAIE